MGAGYTEVFTAAENRFILQIWRPSLVVRSFEECVPSRLISPDHPGAVVMGSGIDANDTHAKKLCLRLLKKIAHPVLLDGGALSFAAQQEGRKALKKRGEKTRHAPCSLRTQEKRLGLQSRSAVSLEEPEKAAKKLARAYKSIIVLKGPETIRSDGARTEVYTAGTAVLAKAGTGDVLAGAIGGLLAQGVAPFKAACLGVALHGEAGKIAAEQFSEVSVCAEEVVESLPQAIQKFLGELDQREACDTTNEEER